MPDRSYVAFPQSQSNVTATIEFDGINFAGASKNEKVQFAFTQNDSETPKIVASMTLARNEKDEIVLYGEALGTGATAVEPTVISNKPRLSEAIAIRVAADLKNGNYRIQRRRPTEVDFTTLGTGRTGKGRTICFGRLRAINDFSANGEYVRIDSIELVTAVGSTAN